MNIACAKLIRAHIPNLNLYIDADLVYYVAPNIIYFTFSNRYSTPNYPSL